MDMHSKREMRKNKKMNEDTKSLPSTSINWFPGHMAKTRRQITEDLKLVDVIVEILDARIPISSQNPEIQEIIKNKKKIIILNKSDLSDEKDNKKWINYFTKKGSRVVLANSNTGKGIDEVIRQIQKAMQNEIDEYKEKGRIGRKIRVMVVGIPNSRSIVIDCPVFIFPQISLLTIKGNPKLIELRKKIVLELQIGQE